MSTNPTKISGAADTPLNLTRMNFISDQEVRWCPGCGDYSILFQVQTVMPKLNIPREKIVFVSGIGCSSRFPYYMNTYGFHGIHGRAPTIASGIKIANPELSVWLVTGDGDGLSIGGNHIVHAMRRNLDMNILLFNNRIYGLTKGQYSPTSEYGKKTKSSPFGTVEHPINPISLAIASEATFIARSVDIDTKHLAATIERAAYHKGMSFVEIFQNCNIFNDGAFKDFTEKEVRSDRILPLEHGKPMIFGKEKNKGIRLNGLKPEVVTLGENGVATSDLLVHNEEDLDPTLAYMLSQLPFPEFPVPIGVFRRVTKPCYEDSVLEQIDGAVAKRGRGDLEKLMNSGDTWVVEEF